MPLRSHPVSPDPPVAPGTALARLRLRSHPQTPCAAVDRVTATLSIERPDILLVRYHVAGALEALRVPSHGSRLDPDRLWAHTCCELFVAPGEGEAYDEWNFSPTGQVAYYEFSSYRQRRASSSSPSPPLSIAVEPDGFRLEARVPLRSGADGSARLSLTTVIEDSTGALSYWALRHPSDRPDFHHRGGFSLRLTSTPTPTIADAMVEPS